MMHVVVAGGAGYVGCVLVRALLARGHRVTVYDRMLFGTDGLADVMAQITCETRDIRELSRDELAGVDAVVNLAGISSDPTAEFRPDLTHEINVGAALRLAWTCKAAGIRRYVFASSCSVYETRRIDDQHDALFDETSPLSPHSAYARSKREAELRLLDMADDRFSPTIVRKGTVFGHSPRMRFDLVVNTLLKDALSRGVMVLDAGGETWRPVVEIGDVALAYMACLEADEPAVRGEIFNVVLANHRVSEMALRIRHTLRDCGVESDIRPDYSGAKHRSYRVSGQKLASRLGFRPAARIEAAVLSTAALVRSPGGLDFENPCHYNARWLAGSVI